MLDTVKLRLAVTVAHLAEFARSKEQMDLIAAMSTLDSDDVRDYLTELDEAALLPVPRDGKTVFDMGVV